MEDEVDSLEHIMALQSSNPMDQKRNFQPRTFGNPQPFEEPSYRLLPSNENHASSFGAGGTISQVVDPHFRPPSVPQNSHTFGQMLDTATLSSNIMSSTLLDYGPPVTVSSFNNVNNNGFGRVPSPPPPPPPPQPQQTGDRQHYQNQNLNLHNHHNPFLPPGGRPSSMDSLRSSANEPYRSPFLNVAPVQQQTFASRNQMPQNVTTTLAPSVVPPIANLGQQTNHPPMSQSPQLSFIPSTSQYKRPVNSAYVAQHANDGPIYEPQPKNPSPPLDQINMPNINGPPIMTGPSSSANTVPNPNPRVNNFNASSNSNPSSSLHPVASSIHVPIKPASVGEALGRIPKKKSVQPVTDRYDEMSMLVLKEKYRECEARLESNKLRRQDIEKTLNDLARNSHGKNIELDPYFRQKKDEQRQCDETILELRAKMKKISEKLSTKFNHKIAPKLTGKPAHMSANRQQPPKRAKMSTAAIAPKENSPLGNKDRGKLMFTMDDSRNWCKICDIHFESFRKYCEHLHKREHLNSMKRSEPPWRKSKDKIDLQKTYNMTKSICARVSNDTDSDFSIATLTKVLCPGTDEKTLKNMSLERERGKLDLEDPLMHIKGYENIIPISGYFCQLCDRSYCDYVAIEQHVKSYEHNYRYAISVANDETSEKTFRQLQEKSFKKQNPEKTTSKVATSTSTRQPVSEASSTASSTTTAPQTVTQYKKPTSHIVDEHEAVVKKFPSSAQPERKDTSNNRTNTTTAKTRSKRIIDSDDSDWEHEPRSKVPEMSSRPVQEERASSAKAFIKNRMPDIVPISDSRSRPSALKQLRNEKRQGTASKPYTISSDSDSAESDTPILDSSQLASGHPDSPFPDLDLSITGNTHAHVLKDKRLSQQCVVKLNRIQIEDFKDMLMDESTLWRRITHLMAKKEGDERLTNLSKQLREKVRTRATYFSASGSVLPIILEKDKKKGNDSDDSDIDEKPKLANLALMDKTVESEKGAPSVAASGHGTNKNTTTITASAAATTAATSATAQKKDTNDNDSDVSDLDIECSDSAAKRFDLNFLDGFFCEK